MRIINFFILFLLITSQVFAHQSNILVESKVDKAIITVGELIKYTLIIEKDDNVQVKLPGPGANLGSFEIRDYKKIEKQKTQKGKLLLQTEYIITTYDTGEYKIPPITIEYSLPDKQTKKIHSQEIKIEVKPTMPQDAKDIKDIKPPVDIKLDLSKYLWILLVIFLILLVGIIGIMYWNKRKKLPLEEELEDIRPPHEIAYEALSKIELSDLLAQGLIKEYYIQVSEVIRQYIESRYKISALESTTQELIAEIKISKMEEGHIELIQNFLEECDLVKFAKYIPHQNEITKIIESAKEIVDKTKVSEKYGVDNGDK
ncbi:MAG: BatD family protein [bacterium]